MYKIKKLLQKFLINTDSRFSNFEVFSVPKENQLLSKNVSLMKGPSYEDKVQLSSMEWKILHELKIDDLIYKEFEQNLKLDVKNEKIKTKLIYRLFFGDKNILPTERETGENVSFFTVGRRGSDGVRRLFEQEGIDKPEEIFKFYPLLIAMLVDLKKYKKRFDYRYKSYKRYVDRYIELISAVDFLTLDKMIEDIIKRKKEKKSGKKLSRKAPVIDKEREYRKIENCYVKLIFMYNMEEVFGFHTIFELKELYDSFNNSSNWKDYSDEIIRKTIRIIKYIENPYIRLKLIRFMKIQLYDISQNIKQYKEKGAEEIYEEFKMKMEREFPLAFIGLEGNKGKAGTFQSIFNSLILSYKEIIEPAYEETRVEEVAIVLWERQGQSIVKNFHKLVEYSYIDDGYGSYSEKLKKVKQNKTERVRFKIVDVPYTMYLGKVIISKSNIKKMQKHLEDKKGGQDSFFTLDQYGKIIKNFIYVNRELIYMLYDKGNYIEWKKEVGCSWNTEKDYFNLKRLENYLRAKKNEIFRLILELCRYKKKPNSNFKSIAKWGYKEGTILVNEIFIEFFEGKQSWYLQGQEEFKTKKTQKPLQDIKLNEDIKDMYFVSGALSFKQNLDNDSLGEFLIYTFIEQIIFGIDKWEDAITRLILALQNTLNDNNLYIEHWPIEELFLSSIGISKSSLESKEHIQYILDENEFLNAQYLFFDKRLSDNFNYKLNCNKAKKLKCPPMWDCFLYYPAYSRSLDAYEILFSRLGTVGDDEDFFNKFIKKSFLVRNISRNCLNRPKVLRAKKEEVNRSYIHKNYIKNNNPQ